MLRSSLWGGSLPLHHKELLAAQNGAGFVNGGHVQIWAVLVLADDGPGAAQGSWTFWFLVTRKQVVVGFHWRDLCFMTTTTSLLRGLGSTPRV